MSNPIGWCDRTINPITGCTNCDENGFCQDKFKCYAEGFAKRLAGKERKQPGSTGYPTEPGQHFKPTFHYDKHWDLLNLPTRGRPKRVFLDSMSDWFCEGVPAEWVHQVLDLIDQVPEHHFLVLTKRPERILEVLHCRNLPPNLWLGVSVTCQEDVWRIEMLKESIPQTTKRFVSFEPLLGPINLGNFGGVDWAIIGAQTGSKKVLPEGRWLWDMIVQIPHEIPIFLKDNIEYISPVGRHQMIPKEMS
jgi:protein gp37